MWSSRGRPTVAVALGVAWMIASQGVALAAAGDLDPTFDRNGKRVIESRDAVSWVGLVQPNARIVLAGWELDHERTIVARLRPNGALDQGFGDGGFVAQPFQAISMTSLRGDAALQDDGDIVMVGSAQHGFATARLLPDGTLDQSFGGDGFAQTRFGANLTGVHNPDEAQGVAMDGSNIVVAGTTDSAHWGLVRYLPDGSRDPSFGTNGKAVADASGYVTDVLVQPDGKILVVGYASFRVTLMRFLQDGAPDPSFGTGGIALPHLGRSGHDIPGRMALMTDGTVLLAGSFDEHFGVLRLTSQGKLDGTFGSGGVVTTEFRAGERASAASVAIQPDDEVVAAGCSVLSAGDGRSALARYLPDGSLDATFGDDGKVLTAWMKRGSGYGGCATDLALMPDGRLVTAAEQSLVATDHMAVARYLAA
jgi:uncharacterized delta-60 repeat protein